MLLLLSEGSVQGLEELPESLRAVYRMAWEVLMRSLIDMAAERGAFIDQSQSLNLFSIQGEDGRPVLGADIPPLPVLRRRTRSVLP